jgi:deoxyribose-phosphate aldolase
MLTEIACYNQDSTYADILETVFIASEKNVDSIAIPSGFMGRVSEFLEHQKFSVAIDFPYGLASTQVRLHEIILAIRQGASFIDLVINNSYVKEENWRKIREDLKSCITACKQNNVELRAIIEYRLFPVKMQTKTGVFVTSCVRGFDKKYHDIFKELDIYCLRLMSSKNAKHLL